MFLESPVHSYRDQHNRFDLDGTSSGLSPYLRFGMISARKAFSEGLKARSRVQGAFSKAGCDAFLDEIIWRDFYLSILYPFPQVLKSAFKPALRNFPWRDSPEDIQAWKEGWTGFRVVDATMRQLTATGA